MLEIAICEDEQADRNRLQGMLYAILDKYNMDKIEVSGIEGESQEYRNS